MPATRTLQMLKACMPECKEPEAWAVAFDAAFGDRPPKDMAMFLAQAGHESYGLNRLEEDLFYRTADRIMKVFPKTLKGWDMAEVRKLVANPAGLANVVYAFKGGNGNTLSGDGWMYRGRGPFQISLKDNYLALQADTGLPVVKDPDLLIRDRKAGAISAVWYWRKHVTDGESIERVTRQINGPAMDGLDRRKARYSLARSADK